MKIQIQIQIQIIHGEEHLHTRNKCYLLSFVIIDQQQQQIKFIINMWPKYKCLKQIGKVKNALLTSENNFELDFWSRPWSPKCFDEQNLWHGWVEGVSCSTIDFYVDLFLCHSTQMTERQGTEMYLGDRDWIILGEYF